MHILIAPDKFKGTLSAPEVCQIVANAFSSRIVSSKITTCPIADGGDGFMDILRHHSQGNLVPCSATDALGRPITAHYALCGNTAVIEMATASGLAHISPHQLDIWESSTIGTGEMIRHATETHHVDRILIGIGGSATNDAGCGMAHALGAQFLDSHQQPISPTPRGLRTCSSINLENVIPLPKITVACDVDNPLLGERGATMTYASQKGASPADLLELENTLHHIAHLTNATHHTVSPGAGAAGGLGFGLLHFCNAALVPGFDLISAELRLEEKISQADIVITGEGKLDAQTTQGKGPAGVAQLARKHNKPVFALAGCIEDGAESLFDHAISLHSPDRKLSETLTRSRELLAIEAKNLAEFIQRNLP